MDTNRTAAATGRVRLTVPAEAMWLRLARLTVAGVAGRLGFDLDAVDDVQIATDELCRFLLSGGGTGTIVIECGTEPDVLTVTGAARFSEAPAGPAALDELARQVLDVVVDAYECQSLPAPRFVFVKRGR